MLILPAQPAGGAAHAQPAYLLAEVKGGDDGLDFHGFHLSLAPADDGDLGRAEDVRAVPLLQGMDDEAELRIGQDAGEGEQGVGRIAEAAGYLLIGGAGRDYCGSGT